MHALAAIALLTAVPFVSALDPQPAAPVPAPQVAPANASAPPTPPAPGSSQLSNLVAEAIKRKLEKASTPGAATIALPPAGNGGAAQIQAPPAMSQVPSSMTLSEGSTIVTAPDPSMVTSNAKLMMGAPVDGSPAYVRVAGAPVSRAATGSSAASANPLAAPADPMETGTAPAAAEPGVSHNLLDIFVGTWDVSANFDNGPGQPPETASGQMTNSWQLDGRWLKQDYSGQMTTLGAFRGLGYLGYDNLAKTYVATWMDTLSTSCLMSRGSFDESKATFTLTGDFTAPGGEKFKQKQVITVLSPDRYTVTMYLAGPDGAEFKTGNLEYTRSVRSITSVPVR